MKKVFSLILVLTMVLSLTVLGANAEPVQEMVYSLYSEPDGIDPGITNNSFASYVLANAFEGLLTYDTETGSVIPGEAEGYTVSEDGLVYTFTLRDGLKWSDGTPHTAEDYVYTIQRILIPATAAMYVNLVTDYVAGAEEYYTGKISDFDAVGIKAPDEKTVVFTLKAPTSFFAGYSYHVDLLPCTARDRRSERRPLDRFRRNLYQQRSVLCNGNEHG